MNNSLNIKDYLNQVLNEKDAYSPLKSDDINTAEYRFTTLPTIAKDNSLPDNKDQIIDHLDRNLLTPQYNYSYIVLDIKYTNFVDNNAQYTITELVFPLLETLPPITSDNSINVKYPIINVIGFKIHPFKIPIYYKKYASDSGIALTSPVLSPPSQRLFINIKEFSDVYKTPENVIDTRLLCDCQYINTTIDGTNKPMMTYVTPAGSDFMYLKGKITQLNSLSITLNDLNTDMTFLSPFPPTGRLIKGNPTRIAFTREHHLVSGQYIVLTEFTYSDTYDATIYQELIRPQGFPITVTDEFNITFAYDSSSLYMGGGFRTIDQLYVPSRELKIPITIISLKAIVA